MYKRQVSGFSFGTKICPTRWFSDIELYTESTHLSCFSRSETPDRTRGVIAFIPMIADRDNAKDMNKRFMIVDFNSYVGKNKPAWRRVLQPAFAVVIFNIFSLLA